MAPHLPHRSVTVVRLLTTCAVGCLAATAQPSVAHAEQVAPARTVTLRVVNMDVRKLLTEIFHSAGVPFRLVNIPSATISGSFDHVSLKMALTSVLKCTPVTGPPLAYAVKNGTYVVYRAKAASSANKPRRHPQSKGVRRAKGSLSHHH